MIKEAIFAGITLWVTSLTGDLLFDIISAIIAYSSARLFWHYFGAKIKTVINKLKAKFK